MPSPEVRQPAVLFLARHLDSGGVTTHMMTLGQGLIARGWRVGLVSAGRFGEHAHGPGWFEASGITHFLVPFMGPSEQLRRSFKSAICLCKLDAAIKSFQPTILHVHWRSTSPYAALESRIRSVPFVSTLHLEGIPSAGVYRFGSRWGQRAIAISSETKQCLMSDFGVSEDKINIVFNGVDSGHFRRPSPQEKLRAREDLGLRPGAPVVSLIGRLEPIKGHGVLLRAAQSALQSFPDLQLLLAGEGSLYDELRAQAQGCGLGECTHFLGHADSRSVLWASDISVLPSYREGFGLAPVEAMLCGVPVIRTPAAGAADQIIDRVTGFVVPFDQHEQLSQKICALLSDKDLTFKMANAAFQKALDHFTVDRMVDGITRIYSEVVEGSSEPGKPFLTRKHRGRL